MYSSTLPSTSTLDGSGWSTPCLGRFTPRKDPVPIVQEAGWATESAWRGAENLPPTGIRFPDRPASSKSLYRLSNPGQLVYVRTHKYMVTRCYGSQYMVIFLGVSTMYRMTQQEISIFCQVIVSIIVRKKFHEHVSNSEWLPRHSCLSLQTQKQRERQLTV